MKKIFNIALSTCISLALVGCATASNNNSSSSTVSETSSSAAESTSLAESSIADEKKSSETVYPVSITASSLSWLNQMKLHRYLKKLLSE